MPRYVDMIKAKRLWEEQAPLTYELIKDDLDKFPSADVVEVVRCKDCWKRGDEDFCPLVSDNCYPPTLPDDWFCKDGERRDDEK